MTDRSRRPDPSPISDGAADASQAHCPPTDGQPKPETMRDTSSTEKTAPTIRTDGGGPDVICDGGEALRGGEDNLPLTPPEVALIHVLRGCNLTHGEIAERVGCAPKTAREYLIESRDAVRDGADPMTVFWRAVSVPEPAESGLVADGGVSE